MRKIDKLLWHAIAPPFLITLAVLTFIVCVHEVGTLSELLITRNASLKTILQIIGAALPAILVFSLPLSFLIGILIGLSGLSGESQITALRACGVPLRSLLRFILMFGALIAAITAFLSMIVLPKTNDVKRMVQGRISLTAAASQIQPRVFNEDLKNFVFYIDDLSVDKRYWSRVFLADNTDPEAARIIIARSGAWISDAFSRRSQLHLEQGSSYGVTLNDPSKATVSLFASTDLPIKWDNDFDPDGEINLRARNVTEQGSLQLWRNAEKASPSERLKQLIEINRRIALPFSVFPFALLGLSLSVSTSKGGRTYGFALSLATVIIFYMLFFNGLRLASVGKVTPWLGAWGADMLFAAIGLLFLTRIEHCFSFGNWISRFLWKYGWDSSFFRRFPFENARSRITKIDKSIIKSSQSIARFAFPKILDLYISRGFLIYFFWSLVTCGTLFILLTLFDLLDDIIRNRIPIIYVLDYFFFYTPQILMVVIPMSVLLAVLINFGILEKNSEITAIKAGGWSLYRIAIPVFIIAAGFCATLFLMQDYVLPYANIRQDQIRNTIKGKPPQTSMSLQRKWIVGESGRIYNYEYFNNSQDSFVNLNIYDVDLKSTAILQQMHAARANIDLDGIWTLENGWIRNYQSQSPDGFRLIKNEKFRFPERAAYFEKEIFEPKESSKKTYIELSRYINYLKKTGYNATELQVELNKKISFPVSCLVMALLAVPFSFSTGKKGAFFGIGLSIAIAMSFWGISGVSEALGTYGLLVPFLAAWAPNILFGAAGLTLLLTIRT
jgi:LPS export ABC transporter permease LptG/LPS export ABC transporter permease LptF